MDNLFDRIKSEFEIEGNVSGTVEIGDIEIIEDHCLDEHIGYE
jgi:cytoskeletal protein CcmA (bactofilin family)